MTKLLGTLTRAAMAVTLTPQVALAQTLPFQGILEGGGPGIPQFAWCGNLRRTGRSGPAFSR